VFDATTHSKKFSFWIKIKVELAVNSTEHQK
jgi:hypothetical protein